jgi:hypothetical protein
MSDAPHLHIEFYTQAQENPAESRKAGRPIFEDVEMVKIQVVGDPKCTMIAPAHSSSKRHPETGAPWTYAEQFPEHYRYFKDNADQQLASGTPLSEVPWLTAAKREELKALKILTVDGLALLDGAGLTRLGMGGRELKNKAQAWLDAAAGHAGESRLAEELAQRDAQIASLMEQMALLTAAAKVQEPEPTEPTEEGVWADYADDDIKVFIAERAGRKPAGNPSRKTLIASANEILEAEKAKDAA